MTRPNRKRSHIRVDLSPEWYGEDRGRLEALKVVLDMLRYSGLLESNVQGFPRLFEYEVDGDCNGIIARWRSFGIQAEEVAR